jgi:moderate conductance mechanosensitive channel
VAVVPGQSDEDEDMVAGSRLATIVPILSRMLLSAALLIAVLAGLSNSGINIAPLLAGAGIFGLAISFGSQALVRDIVSGLFYIFDDAFRVGEYVDTGKNKGTVERIALRSLRLRHQNGQIHTVPYGQLGAVTNFSRDWATIKFNFRLARDSDLEKVRKTAKKLGLELLEDPDIGKEFLSQLKMQGVADVLDTALLVRFKFTCLPARSSLCQREVVKRLYKTFVAAGVEFATNSVTVNVEGALPEPESASEKRVIAEAVAAAEERKSEEEEQKIKAEILLER